MDEQYKNIIIDSLKYCVKNERIVLHGFVIMPNHIHLVLTLLKDDKKEEFQRDFLKFTSQQMIKQLIRDNQHNLLEQFTSSQGDRIYHIWQRRSKWIELENIPILNQKLDYVHNNPTQPHWDLVESPTAYKWSSAYFYENGVDLFDMLQVK